MKIAMFTNNYKPYMGGVPISVDHLAKALRELGHEVYVFAPTYKEQEEEESLSMAVFPKLIRRQQVLPVIHLSSTHGLWLWLNTNHMNQ